MTSIAVSPTGPEAGFIYVTDNFNNSSAVQVISPATNMVVDTITTAPFAGPSWVAVSPTGPNAGYIYATGETTTGHTAVQVINPANNQIGATIPTNFAGPLAVSPTGPAAGDVYLVGTDITYGTAPVFTNEMVVINPANSIVATVTLSPGPSSI